MKHVIALAILIFVAAPVSAEDQSPAQYQNLLTPLLKSGTDVLGAPIVFPDAPPEITAAIVTIPPGGTTGPHHHEVPLFAYILEGELTVEYGDEGTKVYRAGDSVLEAVNWPHNGTNTGNVAMRLIAVYIGGGGKANTIVEPAP